jgi:MFS family permease
MTGAVPRWLAERIGQRFYYGWVIVGAVLLSNLSAFSLNPIFGLYITPLQHTFGWDRATIARSVTLGTVMGAALAPLLGYLADRVGTRAPVILMGLGSAVAYGLLARVQQVWQLNLLVGVLYALLVMGVGQMMSSINVNRWFVRRRGRAMGIVMMGASGGSVVFIPLCTLLMAVAGWRVSFAFQGAAAALLIALPSFLLLASGPEQLGLGGHAELHAAPAGGRAVPAPERHWSVRAALRTRSFWLMGAALMVGTLAVQGYFVHAVPHMEARGFSRLVASAVWSTFFVTGVVAKFGWGFVIERTGVRPAMVLLFLGEVLGLYLLLTARSAAMLFTYAVVNGLLHGPYLQLQAMVWADYYGRRSLGRIYGLVQPAIVVAGSLGPWLGGYLFDVTGSYDRFFTLGMGLCLLAALLVLLAPAPHGGSAGGASAGAAAAGGAAGA